MAALTYQTAYDGAFADANLGHRSILGAVTVARTIFAAESGTPNKRTALATAVLSNPSGLTNTWLALLATDPAIVAAGGIPTDAQITTAITNGWTVVAGT